MNSYNLRFHHVMYSFENISNFINKIKKLIKRHRIYVSKIIGYKILMNDTSIRRHIM